MNVPAYNYSVLERFMRYVRIDTQSDPNSPTSPSTEKQKNLGRLLVQELKDLGIGDAEMDEWGYIYATLPSNSTREVPVICLCSHMDTSPETSGKDVRPEIKRNYQGGDIPLGTSGISILEGEHPELRHCLGHDIICTDGTTLLGADDKAGLAEIMDAIAFFQANPHIPHGSVRILFTPDEEIGRGANKVNLSKLGAKYGYTVDGESRGSIEDETFSADMAKIRFFGTNVHPGYAKGRLVNALKVAGTFIDSLPKQEWSPETTSGRQGFVHPYDMQGGVETATITLILRSFDDKDLAEYAHRLRALAQAAVQAYPGARFEIELTEQYRNMKNVLKDCPEVVEFAVEAISRAGMKPDLGSIRGGTDGSRLSFMGLPCPNLFAGGHSFHSKTEWISVQDMQAAVDMLVELVKIWEEKAQQEVA
jgi:tripeptide aminopeptidase